MLTESGHCRGWPLITGIPRGLLTSGSVASATSAYHGIHRTSPLEAVPLFENAKLCPTQMVAISLEIRARSCQLPLERFRLDELVNVAESFLESSVEIGVLDGRGSVTFILSKSQLSRLSS